MLSLVIPTYNEAENIGPLIEEIFNILGNVEVIVVDDNSPDGTGKIAEKLAKKYGVRVIHREGKLGLSSAVLEGFSNATGDVLGVMDADGSHPVKALPKMLKKIQEGSDVVIGSRYTQGGNIENWPMSRKIISKGATTLARPLTRVKDPMSGLMFLKKDVIKGKKLNPKGYKICLEILVKGDYNTVAEVPITFIDRQKGESKLNWKEHVNYLRHLLGLYLYKLRG